MQKFLAEKALIPHGNLMEVRFEDLEAAPLDQLRRVYEGLGLPGFNEAKPSFRAYIDSVTGYQKNEYAVTDDIIEKVNRHWRFAFDAWGYTPVAPEATGFPPPA
jgi:hypothetical protein